MDYKIRVESRSNHLDEGELIREIHWGQLLRSL
jgi:hypothetical protein